MLNGSGKLRRTLFAEKWVKNESNNYLSKKMKKSSATLCSHLISYSQITIFGRAINFKAVAP